MKKTLIFLPLLLILISKEFKAQTWQFATKLEGTLGATDNVVIKGVDVDVSGNSYVTGYYTGQLNNTAISTSDQQDGFVAKFDASGTLQWAHKFGGVGNDAGNAISYETYGSGAFYITGYVQYNDPAAVTFNSGSGSTSLPSVTACIATPAPNNIYLRGGLTPRQAFVAKYTSGGNLVWVKPVYAPSCENAEGLGISASYRHTNGANYERHVYVTGYFEGNGASFMQSSPCTFINVNGNIGNETGFIAKLNGSSGNAIWAKSYADVTNASAMSIGKDVTLDAASALGYIPGGGLFITGDYMNSADICGTGVTNGSGSTLAFVASLNPSTGNANWATEIEATGPGANVEARDVSCRHGNYDEMFALGDYSGGSVISGGSPAASGGGRDVYLIKLTKTTGAVSIVKSEGGTDDQYGDGMEVSWGGYAGIPEVFVSGGYDNSINFVGGASFGFYGSTTNDHYMVKYDLSLNYICATHWDASMILYTNTIDACDVATGKGNLDGSAYLGGLFLNAESPSFSPIPALTTSKPISGYVAKWICCDCPPPTITSVDRPAPGTTATVYFSYPDCDNPSGFFNISYQTGVNPAMFQPVSWGVPSITIPGLDPLPATYKWVTTNNCSNASNLVIARTTSLNEFDMEDAVSLDIYPNPSQNIIHFESNQPGKIEVYNILGELVGKKEITASKTDIDVTELPSGNYVCKFTSASNKVITKKVQVAH